MSVIDSHFSQKTQKMAVLAVTLGNLLEWYEIYLYVYWAPIISKLFFHSGSPVVDLIHTFLIFALGFLARPFGGIILGRFGDLFGRRKSLILSIGLMIIPTFIISLLPTHENVGVFAPIMLCLMRILQSFPAGGELPGAACYLYESAPWQTRHFLCSWTSWGYQLGILLSTIECFLMEKYLSPEQLISWGWRASFLGASFIGLFGLFLRYRLHETPLFKEMHTHERVAKEPIGQVLRKRWKGLVLGVLYCALNSSGFYLLTVNVPTYLAELLGTSYQNNLVITIGLVVLITVPLPFFGKLADRYNCNKALLIGATLGTLAILYPLYWSIHHASLIGLGVSALVFALLLTYLSAIVPYVQADLYPTHDRFTCTALSFNVADATIGGFTPMMTLYLFNVTQDPASFVWIIALGALLSLAGFSRLKPRRTH